MGLLGQVPSLPGQGPATGPVTAALAAPWRPEVLDLRGRLSGSTPSLRIKSQPPDGDGEDSHRRQEDASDDGQQGPDEEDIHHSVYAGCDVDF